MRAHPHPQTPRRAQADPASTGSAANTPSISHLVQLQPAGSFRHSWPPTAAPASLRHTRCQTLAIRTQCTAQDSETLRPAPRGGHLRRTATRGTAAASLRGDRLPVPRHQERLTLCRPAFRRRQGSWNLSLDARHCLLLFSKILFLRLRRWSNGGKRLPPLSAGRRRHRGGSRLDLRVRRLKR